MYVFAKMRYRAEGSRNDPVWLQSMKKLESEEFSIVLGGPLFQLLLKLGLITSNFGLLKKRIIVLTLLAWLPLFFLSLLDGKAWTTEGMPFLKDMEAQARFLVALPLLILAELLVHKRLRLIVGQFLERDIITKKVFPKFKELIISAMNLRNSMAIELLLLLLTFVGGHYLTNTVSILEEMSSNSDTWYGSSGGTLTLAGYWYFFVSRPLFQFILFRWYFRMIVWMRFLWQTSKLDLKLIPTHPDHACGLGFLASSIIAFTPLVVAHGIILSGLIGNAIFFAGAKLSDFMALTIGVLLFIQVLILGPLVVFSRNLLRAKLNGLREYGALASEYTNDFDYKWLHKRAVVNEALLGSSDIQSLADMGNSFQVVRNIQSFPFNKNTSISLALFTLIPIIPLLLTMIPLEELVKKFIGILL